MQDKAAQRTRVIFELGMLLAPVYGLIKKTPPPVSAEYRIASAKLHRDVSNFIREEVGRFTRFDTIEFGRERNDISNTLYGLANLLNRLSNNTTDDDRKKTVST